MNAKTYSLSVAKMIAGSKSKKGVLHIAVAVSDDQYMVVNKADYEATQAVTAKTNPTKRRAAKDTSMVTATLPVLSGNVDANSHWVGAVAEDGKVCWFLKSAVTHLDAEAGTVTVVIPKAKSTTSARKSVNWLPVAI